MTLKLQPAVRGGDHTRKKSLVVDKAFRSCPPHFACIAYLEPKSNRLKKPVGGLSRVCLTENVEDRSPIACSANQKHVKNYLKRGYKSPQAPSRYLRILHCSTFGQIKHSSGNGSPSGKVFKSPEKCAHFAGESNTFGYSVAFTPTTFILSITKSSFDMQNGHA